MNFDIISGEITYADGVKTKRQFDRTLIDLGVRKNNEHVGSGMGGDNFQLLVLMSLKHSLACNHQQSSPLVFVSSNKIISWNSSWLKGSSLKTIREELNILFPNISEEYKYLGMMCEALGANSSLRTCVQQYQEHFPNLAGSLEGKYFYNSTKLSNIEQLIQAYVMCQELAYHLDRGDTSLIQPMGGHLSQFPPEIILMSVRKFIQIERLVRHNLDEDPVFGPILNRINSLVDD